MAQAPRTTMTYPLDGANRDFQIPFEYLARKFVQVTLVGVDRKVLTLNIDYRFTQRTIITLTKNWGPTDGYQLVEIRRYTSATERLVDFSDGSILRAYDLNTSQVQSLHIAEEGRDIATDTIGVNNDGNLDARGRKIVNVADGVGDFDAVNLHQQKQWAGSALNQANRSKTEADRSQAQAGASAGSAGKSAQSAAASAASAAASERSTQSALSWANESSRHSGEAKAQADRATQQANLATTNGAAQVGRAKTEADRSTVRAGESAASALRSEDGAKRANADATRSKAEADRAKTEADKLGNANQLMGAVEVVSGVDVTWKGVHKVRGAVRIVGNEGFMPQVAMLHENGQQRTIINSGSTMLFHNINNGTNLATLDASGKFDTLGQLLESGHRVWTRESLNENYLIKGTGGKTVKGNYNSMAGVLYSNVTLTNQVYNSAIEIRENGLVGMGGASPGHEYNAPSLTFHWGGAIVKKLFMTSDGNLNWGNHTGMPARLGPDGNVHGEIWGGWLSNWINSKLDTKMPYGRIQSGRTHVGAPANGYATIRVNFNSPLPDPVVTVTPYIAGAAPLSYYTPQIKSIDANGFTVCIHTHPNHPHMQVDWIATSIRNT